MTDIVERLRHQPYVLGDRALELFMELQMEAANEIELLRRKINELSDEIVDLRHDLAWEQRK